MLGSRGSSDSSMQDNSSSDTPFPEDDSGPGLTDDDIPFLKSILIKEYKTITLQEIDSIAVLKLNRPEKLNAFNMQMLEDIMDAFDEVDRNDNLKAIILSGAGRAFCAGADLSAGDKTFDKNFDTRGEFEEDFRRDAGGIFSS